jgi:hypothetical protein
MVTLTKGQSPFHPGQPVPVELFTGRQAQIERIVSRGIGQVSTGKLVAMFVQGEYGIGKSSVAIYALAVAEKEYNLHAIYASLGGARSLQDVAMAIVEATVKSGANDSRRSEKIREWLKKYIYSLELFGVRLNLDALRNDSVNWTTPYSLLGFLQEAMGRLREDGIKGLFLVLDEINGIAGEADFAYFLKGLIDTNARERKPLPFLLMLCGVSERRREMIQKHQPVDRIFDVIDIERMTDEEMRSFFEKAFESAQMRVEPTAFKELIHYSAGFPKIMHLVGDAAFWIDRDGIVDLDDAMEAVIAAADEVGKKYVDQQIYKALQSEDYRSILSKIASLSITDASFRKQDVAARLTENEKKKLNNFLQKMKKLHVLRSGEVSGEYIFDMLMVRLYIFLQSSREAGSPPRHLFE